MSQGRLRLFVHFVCASFFCAPSFAGVSTSPIELLVSDARGGRVFEGPNGQVVATYQRPNGIGSDIYITSQHGPGTVTSLPDYYRTTDGVGSAGGVVLKADLDGFIPNFYYFIDSNGSVTLRPQYPSIPAYLGSLSVAPNSQIGFIARTDTTNPPNLVYSDNPFGGSTPAQQIDTSSLITAGESFGNSTLFDSQSRLLVTKFDGSSMAFNGTAYRRDGSTWTALPQSGTWLRIMDIAPDDRFVYSVNRVMPSIYRSDQPTQALFNFTDDNQLLYGEIADDGAIAASTVNQVVYISPQGSVVDLGALAGPGNPVTGDISMNSSGEVAMYTDGADPKLWLFDGTTLSLVASGLPQIFSGQAQTNPSLLLTDYNEIYFYGKIPNTTETQLFRIAVPEPTCAALFAGVWFAFFQARRRDRTRN